MLGKLSGVGINRSKRAVFEPTAQFRFVFIPASVRILAACCRRRSILRVCPTVASMSTHPTEVPAQQWAAGNSPFTTDGAVVAETSGGGQASEPSIFEASLGTGPAAAVPWSVMRLSLLAPMRAPQDVPVSRLARLLRVSGEVMVTTVIATSGGVVSAVAVSGPPLLSQSAEKLVMGARFSPRLTPACCRIPLLFMTPPRRVSV